MRDLVPGNGVSKILLDNGDQSFSAIVRWWDVCLGESLAETRREVFLAHIRCGIHASKQAKVWMAETWARDRLVLSESKWTREGLRGLLVFLVMPS